MPPKVKFGPGWKGCKMPINYEYLKRNSRERMKSNKSDSTTTSPGSVQFSSFQSLSCVQLFVTPWIAAHQASCLSPSPGVHSNSRPSSRWCHLAISSFVVPFSSCPQSHPATGSFPMSQFFTSGVQILEFRFNISPSNEHPGLMFRMDWLDLLEVQGTQESSPTPQFKSINSSALSFLHIPTLTSIHDHRKNHSLD